MRTFHGAAELLCRSWNPLLSILPILLLPHALAFFVSYPVATPLATDLLVNFFTMRAKDPGSPERHELLKAAMDGLGGVTGAETLIVFFSFMPSSFLLMVVVYTVAMASKGERVTPKGLLGRMTRTWGTGDVHRLEVLISALYVLGLSIWIPILPSISSGSMAVLALGAVLAILAILLLVYRQTVLYHGLVVSAVLEEDCEPFAALASASELIPGRRFSLLVSVNILLLLITVVISGAYCSVNTPLPPMARTQMVGGLITIYAGFAVSVLVLVAYMVFYLHYESTSRKSGGEDAAAMEERSVYTRATS